MCRMSGRDVLRDVGVRRVLVGWDGREREKTMRRGR